MNYFKKLLFVLLLVCPISLYGQKNVFVNLSVERDSQGHLVFYAQNTSQKKFHIIIEFTKLMNLRCDCGNIFEGNIGQGRTKLTRLVQFSDIGGIDYDYSWSFREGWANPKVNREVKYLLPVASGTETITLNMSNVRENFAEEEVSDGFYAIGFKMNQGDTVFAARRGIVEYIYDSGVPQGTSLTYWKNANRVIVRHKDKTEATYSVLKSGSFFVKPGQAIEAGQPLAIAGGENYLSGPQVRFYVSYLQFDKKEFRKRYNQVYIRPRFTTANETNIVLEEATTYVSLHSPDLIYQEWTKRELKRMRKKKK